METAYYYYSWSISSHKIEMLYKQQRQRQIAEFVKRCRSLSLARSACTAHILLDLTQSSCLACQAFLLACTFEHTLSRATERHPGLRLGVVWFSVPILSVAESHRNWLQLCPRRQHVFSDSCPSSSVPADGPRSLT